MKRSTFLQYFFWKILHASYRYSWGVILVYICLLLGSIYNFKDLKLELDIYDVRNDNFASSTNWFKLRHEFKDPNSLYFIWKPSDPLNAKMHCRWQQEIQKIRNEEASITRSFQIYALRGPVNDNGDLLYKKIFPDPCLEKIEASSFKAVKASYLNPIIIDKNNSSFLTEISFESEDEEALSINTIERISKSLIETNKNIDPLGMIQTLGPLSYRLEFKKILANDLYLNLGLFIFIVIFFRIFLGTWMSGLIYITATLLTIIYMLGFMSFMKYPIDVLTNNLILMTVIAGTADFLFLSFESFTQKGKRSFYRIITACFFTTFTTMMGFISLYSSDLNMIIRFGMAAATGAFFEWAVLFNLLPAVISCFGIKKSWVNKQKALDITYFKKFLSYTPSKKVIYAFLLFSAGAFIAWPHMNYSDSPKNNFPKSHPLRITIEQFKNDFNWEGNISLLFKKEVSDKEMNELLKLIKKNHLVYYIENKMDLLDNWTKDFDSPLRRDLIIRDFASTPLYNRYESNEYKRAVIYLKNVNTVEMEKFQNFVQKVCANDCLLSGQALVYLELNKRVSYAMLESFVTSIILVLFIIFLIMRVLKIKGARFKDVALASLVAPLFMITLIALIQTPVNVVTSIFFAALVGLTGDNAIQYLFASSGGTLDKGLKLRGDASLVFSLLLILGSLFFIGQTLIPLKWLGVLFSLGFLVTFIGDYWILKGLSHEDKK